MNNVAWTCPYCEVNTAGSHAPNCIMNNNRQDDVVEFDPADKVHLLIVHDDPQVRLRAAKRLIYVLEKNLIEIKNKASALENDKPERPHFLIRDIRDYAMASIARITTWRGE